MGFMGQQSQQKGNEEAEVSAKPLTVEHSATASKEDDRVFSEEKTAVSTEENMAVSLEENMAVSTEEKMASPVEDKEEPELVKDQESVEETVPAENIAPAVSVEIDKEKDNDEVEQPKIDSEKEVSEVMVDAVPSQETVEETKSSAEGEATTEPESKEMNDRNVERETEPISVEIAPDVSDNAPSNELRHESEEKPTAVVSDAANEELINPEPAKTLVDASNVEPVQEEPKKEDTEKEEKKEEGEKVVISHDFTESQIELEKLRKEMKMMEAALQGAARQAQVLIIDRKRKMKAYIFIDFKQKVIVDEMSERKAI